MPAHRSTGCAARCVVTVNPAPPRATQVAPPDGRILAVGGPACMQAWGDPMLDSIFADKVLLPGFVEGDGHLKESSMWDMPLLGWIDRRDPRALQAPAAKHLVPRRVGHAGLLPTTLRCASPRFAGRPRCAGCGAAC